MQQKHATLAAAVEGIYLFYEIHGPYAEGLALFARAVARYEGNVQSADLLGRLTIRLGGFHFHLGEYELAERYVQAGITHTQELSEHAFAYIILGETAFHHSNRALAEEYMRKSLSLSRQAGHLYGEASVLQRLMFIVLHRGDSAEALFSIEEALRLYRRIGPPDRLAFALSEYGLLLGCLGRYDEAEPLCQESLAICTEIGYSKGIFFSLDAQGWIRWCRGENLTQARAEMEQALALARQMNSRHFISMILSELSQLLADMGEADTAVRLGAQGVTIARELASPERLTHSLFCLAAAYLAAGDLEAAAVDLREGLSLSGSVPFLSHAMATLYFCGELWARLGEQLTGAPRQARLRSAYALLAFVRDHPACWRVFQDRAARRLAQVETAILPEIISSAPLSPMHELGEIVQIVLNDLA